MFDGRNEILSDDQIAVKLSEIIFAQASLTFVETQALSHDGLVGFADMPKFRVL